MKATMNSRNIAKFHKMLRAEVPLSKCSKLLKIEVKTLKKFTPEVMKKAGVKLTNIASAPSSVEEVTGTAAASKPAAAPAPAAAK